MYLSGWLANGWQMFCQCPMGPVGTNRVPLGARKWWHQTGAAVSFLPPRECVRKRVVFFWGGAGGAPSWQKKTQHHVDVRKVGLQKKHNVFFVPKWFLEGIVLGWPQLRCVPPPCFFFYYHASHFTTVVLFAIFLYSSSYEYFACVGPEAFKAQGRCCQGQGRYK